MYFTYFHCIKLHMVSAAVVMASRELFVYMSRLDGDEVINLINFKT